MERKIETIKVTTADGRTSIFEIIEDPDRFIGRRAYVQGKTLFYELPIFEAGLLKAASVERTTIQ